MSNGVGEVATDPLWWIGWSPVATASVAAAAGVVAGYLLGWLAAGTAAFGVVVVALGVVLSLIRRACLVAAVGSVVAFFVVGAGDIEDALEGIGVGTGWAEAVSVRVLEMASFVGVGLGGESGRTATEVVGGEVSFLAVSSLAGAAVGGGVWLVGAYVVNRRHAGVRERLVGVAREEGERVLGDDGSFHTLTHGEGSIPLVDPSERYCVANFLVGEQSVCLHYGSEVDMESREVDISDSTKELYYDQISSVDYGGERLRIGSADGGTVKVVTSEKPVGLMEEIDERVQKYKSYAGTAEAEAEEEGDPTGSGSGARQGADPDSDSEPRGETRSETEIGTEVPEPERKEDETEGLGVDTSEEDEDALGAFGDAVGEGGDDPADGEESDDEGGS